MQANKQNMIAVSAEFKNFVIALCGEYPNQPGKTTPHDLTQREACDALMAVAESVRAVEKVETSEEGEEITVTVDLLDLEIKRTLALRAANTRANTAASKLAAQEKELKELKALLAKLQGTPAEAESEG